APAVMSELDEAIREHLELRARLDRAGEERAGESVREPVTRRARREPPVDWPELEPAVEYGPATPAGRTLAAEDDPFSTIPLDVRRARRTAARARRRKVLQRRRIVAAVIGL